MLAAQRAWQPAPFEVSSPWHTYRTGLLGHVFAGGQHCIVRIAPELEGLTGIQVPAASKGNNDDPLMIRVKEPVKVLIGLPANAFHNVNEHGQTPVSQGNRTLDGSPLLKNAVTVTGLPPIHVYALDYGKGTHHIAAGLPRPFILLGIVNARQPLRSYDAGLPDGRDWEPFIVDGFSDEPPLFDIIGGPDKPVIDEGMPGTASIQGGFEGGACVKVNGTYHLFPTERAGEPGVAKYFDRVKTRIGHWTSTDAIHWTRRAPLYEASGRYALTADDNPLNDRRGAIWSFMPIFNEKANRWYGYYLAYTVHREISPNHSFGRIWRAESEQEGIGGIGGPYHDKGIIMEPGLDTQLWEGRQGVAFFCPFPVDSSWMGFYGGAYPYAKREDYPDKTGQGWYVGLARASTPEGPWTRMDTTVNPVTSIHPTFVENPIVSRLPNGLHIAIFDGGPDGWGLHYPNMFAYSLSKDGIHWTAAHYLPIQTKVKKWWDIMRTPVCLIPEGNDVYTILYAAIDNARRFHPMGMVRVKLNRKALDDKMKTLSN